MKKVIISIVLALVVIGLIVFDATNTKPHQITVRNEYLSSSKISKEQDGMTICFFSDLDFGSIIDEDDLNNLVSKINNYKPDVIIFGGDLTDGKSTTLTNENNAILVKFLSELKANVGKYAILGELDQIYLNELELIYKQSDFKLLVNQNAVVYYNNQPINLVGLDSSVQGQPDIYSSYKDINENNYTICLTHCPDLFNNIALEYTDYCLAGHSYGCKVYFPLINYFYRIDGAKEYCRGKYNNADVTLDITNGVGIKDSNIRLFADAEIVIYKLKANQ